MYSEAKAKNVHKNTSVCHVYNILLLNKYKIITENFVYYLMILKQLNINQE